MATVEGMYELLFSSQQPKAKEIKKYCCNVLSTHIQQQLINNMVDDLGRNNQQAISDSNNETQVI